MEGVQTGAVNPNPNPRLRDSDGRCADRRGEGGSVVVAVDDVDSQRLVTGEWRCC